jgi:hypothetical protein
MNSLEIRANGKHSGDMRTALTVCSVNYLFLLGDSPVLPASYDRRS